VKYRIRKLRVVQEEYVVTAHAEYRDPFGVQLDNPSVPNEVARVVENRVEEVIEEEREMTFLEQALFQDRKDI
jgi:hypothetical protein